MYSLAKMKALMEHMHRAMTVANTLYAKVAQGQVFTVHTDRTGASMSTPDSVSTSPRTVFLAVVSHILFYYKSELNLENGGLLI